MTTKAPAPLSLSPQHPHAHGSIDDAIGFLIYLDEPRDDPWTERLVTLLSSSAWAKKRSSVRTDLLRPCLF